MVSSCELSRIDQHKIGPYDYHLHIQRILLFLLDFIILSWLSTFSSSRCCIQFSDGRCMFKGPAPSVRTVLHFWCLLDILGNICCVTAKRESQQKFATDCGMCLHLVNLRSALKSPSEKSDTSVLNRSQDLNRSLELGASVDFSDQGYRYESGSIL